MIREVLLYTHTLHFLVEFSLEASQERVGGSGGTLTVLIFSCRMCSVALNSSSCPISGWEALPVVLTLVVHGFWK